MGSRLEKNSSAVRKRLERHEFTGEDGEEYAPSAFGGFPDYFRRKKIKLQNVDAEIRASSGGNKPPIFRGVVGHVIGYTQPSLSDLHRLIVEHGGLFLQYLDGKTTATHIICSSLPPKKVVEYARYRMVKPAWVVDSIQAGRLLHWADYRIIDEAGARQKTIRVPHGGKMVSQATQQTTTPLRYREQTQNSFYTAQLKGVAQGSSSPLVTPRAAKPVESIEDPPDDEDMDFDDTADLVAAVERAERETREPAEGSPAEREQMPPPPPPPAAAQSPQPDPPGPSKERKGCSEVPEGRPLTSEEHNAVLLSDPRMRKSSTANPEFLKQYYSESRLHHLSTWKAELKSRMQRLAADRGAPPPAKRKPGSRRYVMHVDFDSFFCAVSLLKHAPEFTDKPAVVAHGTGTGSEIASCNYPARAFGVKNGMWMKRALELCADLKVLGYDFPAYEEASARFYDAVLAVGGVVQSVSIDEALVDITSLVLSAAASKGVGVSEGSVWREQEHADQIARELRERIRRDTGCAVSVGIGGNILLAKVALRKAKPAGQYQLRPEEVLEVLADLKVEDLPGVAYSIGGKLEEIGVKLVRDIRATTRERLTAVLGPKTGERLWDYARGIDRTEVGEQPVRKSVSAEVNWGIRFVNQGEAEEFVGNLCRELERRLLNEGVRGRHLTVKIMRRAADAPLDPPKHLGHGKCDTFSRSVVFGVATSSGETIGREAVAVLRAFGFSPGDLRGIGVQLTKLEPLKASAPDGNQKRLTFAAPPSAKKQKTTEAIEDGTPEKPKTAAAAADEPDPIADDPLTPRKPTPRVHPALALARAAEADASATTPLNVTGTQFIMPSNADPAVLAELPADIRRHFAARPQNTNDGFLKVGSRDPSPRPKSRTQSPALPLQDDTDIPPDVDPEVFAALPAEMQAEILASYGRSRSRGQALHRPQTPRKDRVLQRPTAAVVKKTPTKRGGRGGKTSSGLFSRARTRQQQQDAAGGGLHQTNFLTAAAVGKKKDNERQEEETAEEEEVGEIDPSFLAELPEDVRREVVADHRRRRMAARSGLVAPTAVPPPKKQDNKKEKETTTVLFPSRPPRVGLGGSGVRDTAEVRDMISAWHRETRAEGPHRDDVAVLARYLARVVTEERDMEKARGVVRWLEWVVEEDDGGEGGRGKGKTAWRAALDEVKGRVREAMGERGLGRMEFG